MPSPRASGTVLDADALARLQRTMGTEEEFRSMLSEFVSASARVMDDLDSAAGSGRARDAERAAHTLKSMARMVGASELAESCAQAEASRAPLPAAHVARLHEAVAKAQQAVKACLD